MVVLYGTDLTIDNTTFKSNHADNNGGAIYSNGTDLTIDNTTFKSNHADNNGGAINSQKENLKIFNATFESNTANYGGAIYSSGNNADIDLAYFNDNNATNGSAIYKTADSSGLNISNTLFERNQAHSQAITIVIEGNETYALATVTVKISLIANDNIANAIWNDGSPDSIQ